MFMRKLTVVLGIGLILSFVSGQARANNSSCACYPVEESFTGAVVENCYPAPFGSDYRTWTLTLRTPDGYVIPAEEKGFNPLPMVKAYYLAEIAQQAGDPITVTGKMKDGNLMLSTVEYQGYTIHTDEGPFVPYYYGDCYPGSPLFYGGYTFYPGEMPF